MNCPGGSEYGHGHALTVVHAGGCCLRHNARALGLPVELKLNGAKLAIAALVPIPMWTGSLGYHLYTVARTSEHSETFEARWYANPNPHPSPALFVATGATPELAVEALRQAMQRGSLRLLDALKAGRP